MLALIIHGDRLGGPGRHPLVVLSKRQLFPRFPVYAALLGGEWAGGGPWLCRVRLPSGLVAVVVPSLRRVRAQPHRWIAVR